MKTFEVGRKLDRFGRAIRLCKTRDSVVGLILFFCFLAASCSGLPISVMGSKDKSVSAGESPESRELSQRLILKRSNLKLGKDEVALDVRPTFQRRLRPIPGSLELDPNEIQNQDGVWSQSRLRNLFRKLGAQGLRPESVTLKVVYDENTDRQFALEAVFWLSWFGYTIRDFINVDQLEVTPLEPERKREAVFLVPPDTVAAGLESHPGVASRQEVRELLKGKQPLVVDLQPERDYLSNELPSYQTINLPLEKLEAMFFGSGIKGFESELKELGYTKNQKLILIDKDSARVRAGYVFFQMLGYTNTKFYPQGYSF